MKYKNIFGFFSGLILGNIYFVVEDNKKLNKLRLEIDCIRSQNTLRNCISLRPSKPRGRSQEVSCQAYHIPSQTQI